MPAGPTPTPIRWARGHRRGSRRLIRAFRWSGGVAAAVVVAGLMTACTSSSSPAVGSDSVSAPSGSPSLVAGPPAGASSGAIVTGSALMRVDPVTAPFDQPFTTQVSGLTPGSKVVLELTTVDAHGVVWSSQAWFLGDGSAAT